MSETIEMTLRELDAAIADLRDSSLAMPPFYSTEIVDAMHLFDEMPHPHLWVRSRSGRRNLHSFSYGDPPGMVPEVCHENKCTAIAMGYYQCFTNRRVVITE